MSEGVCVCAHADRSRAGPGVPGGAQALDWEEGPLVRPALLVLRHPGAFTLPKTTTLSACGLDLGPSCGSGVVESPRGGLSVLQCPLGLGAGCPVANRPSSFCQAWGVVPHIGWAVRVLQPPVVGSEKGQPPVTANHTAPFQSHLLAGGDSGGDMLTAPGPSCPMENRRKTSSHTWVGRDAR